jgi:hypothetical protein
MGIFGGLTVVLFCNVTVAATKEAEAAATYGCRFLYA